MRIWRFFLIFVVFSLAQAPLIAQEGMKVIGQVVSSESSAKMVFVEIVEIINMPDYVRKAWLKKKDGKIRLTIHLSQKEKPAWITNKDLLIFSLYPLEHTTDFGVIGVIHLGSQPSDQEILACHNQILSIKPGMNRKQVEKVAKRSDSETGIYKNELYLGCQCDTGRIYVRQVWLKPKGMPENIYWTVEEYDAWLKENNESGPITLDPTDLVVQVSEPDCVLGEGG